MLKDRDKVWILLLIVGLQVTVLITVPFGLSYLWHEVPMSWVHLPLTFLSCMAWGIIAEKLS